MPSTRLFGVRCPLTDSLHERPAARGSAVDLRSKRRAARGEEGVALAISLVLLLAMTVLGVATLSSTSLNEKMTSNAQQKAIAFEVAESAIASVWDKSYLEAAINSDPNNAGNDPDPIIVPENDTAISTDYDLISGGKGVDIDGVLTVQFCGEAQPEGTSLNADEGVSPPPVAYLIDVNSIVNIATTSTRADHVQRAAFSGPRTFRTGVCPAR